MKIASLLLLLIAFNQAEAGIFKCKVDGKTVISQFKCATGDKIEKLNIKENDYSLPHWKAIDKKIELQAVRKQELKKQRAEAFEQHKRDDIARVARKNANNFRKYQVEMNAYREAQIQQRHQDRMDNLQTIVNLRYNRY
jgi:hypothetical protein